MYLPYNYESIKPNAQSIELISDYINSLSSPIFPIRNFGRNPLLMKLDMDKSFDERKKQFDKRATCSGNYYSLFILPDGKVESAPKPPKTDFSGLQLIENQ